MQNFRSEIIKYLCWVLAVMFSPSYAQDCLPLGVFFNNQSEIDNFSGCTIIAGNVSFISGNSGITNIDGLSQVEIIEGDLNFSGMTDLLNIDGLSNLKTIGGNLSIEAVPNIQNLNGLSSLKTIGGDLQLLGVFDELDLLEDISGLSNLLSIGENIDVNNFEKLESLNGLQNAVTVSNGTLDLFNNSILNDISALSNYDNIVEIFVQQNPMLSNCALQTFCERGSTLTHTIQNNAIGCNSFQEIASQCVTLKTHDYLEITQNSVFYPNPVIGNFISIELDSKKASIYDFEGRVVIDEIKISDNRIDLSLINTGVYFIKFEGVNNIYKLIRR